MDDKIDLSKLLKQLNGGDKNVCINYPFVDIPEFDVLPDIVKDFAALLHYVNNDYEIPIGISANVLQHVEEMTERYKIC